MTKEIIQCRIHRLKIEQGHPQLNYLNNKHQKKIINNHCKTYQNNYLCGSKNLENIICNNKHKKNDTSKNHLRKHKYSRC